MNGTGFWWILAAVVLYGIVHSILAANQTKTSVTRWIGRELYNRFYRLFFVLMGALTFLPSLILTAALPDRQIYTIPSPWVLISLLLQAAGVVGLGAGVMQTGALTFLGITQVLAGDTKSQLPAPERLVTDGLYRWVRHPLYTCSLLFIWLTPTMTWNILALNLGITAYLWIGSIFEERKLVEQFGEAYINYRQRTPRIIPGIKR